MLICPVCHKTLKKQENRYVCENKHSFDVAKQGYTNLYLKSSAHSGDNKEMVKARTDFLNKGFYQPLRDSIIDWIKQLNIETIIDAGCGEGYYTNEIQKELNNCIYAFDLSKEALKYAARQNKNVNYYISSIFELPIEKKSSDLVLNVFAPFAQEEFYRVLNKNGYVMKVDPAKDHLYEMKEVLYDTVLLNDEIKEENEFFKLIEKRYVCFSMNLMAEDIKNLFKMTPYYYKTSIYSKNKLLQLTELNCRASFVIYLFKKK